MKLWTSANSMKPSEIYKALLGYKNVESDMCSQKSQCTIFSTCSAKSVTKVIDFDKIKDEYCKSNAIHPLWKSVDGVCAKQDDSLFLFIEKKSWLQFFVHQEHSEEKVSEQANDFSLNDKYEKSVEICSKITGQMNLFTEDNHAFLFFSDINPDDSPLIALQYNLNMLAGTSTDIKAFAVETTHQEIDKVKCKKRRYVFCRNFDNFIRGS